MLYDTSYQWNVIFPFVKLSIPAVSARVRNYKVDLSALGFEMCILRDCFFPDARAPASVTRPLFTVASCRAVAPQCRDSHWSDFAPFLECVRGRVRRPELRCTAASSIFRRLLYRSSSAVHVIHPCCELAVVRIYVCSCLSHEKFTFLQPNEVIGRITTLD